MPLDSLTRRRILAAVGSAGALYLGMDRAAATLGYGTVDMNQRTVNGTYAQTQGFADENPPPRIGLTWREIVNGTVQEDTGLTSTTDGEAGSVGLIVDEAVVPGDSGSVTMRARLLSGADVDAANTANAELYLLAHISDTAENGINEPERDAGDTADTDGLPGDLAEHVRMAVWVDESILTGDGNGELEDLPIIGDTPIAEGSLAQVATASDLAGDARGNTGGYRISVGGDTCLSPGDEVYVSFEWEIPESVGNVIQGDSATFQVGFDPRPCPE
ncbi:hypothetical protein [Haloplanus natans]|uniref:hypothetical protein n=1 Tax=Haloplanus natans TaxID=376171 RepID=UPI00067789A0|nr:hypothetical protein [Haloplanus natans]